MPPEDDEEESCLQPAIPSASDKASAKLGARLRPRLRRIEARMIMMFLPSFGTAALRLAAMARGGRDARACAHISELPLTDGCFLRRQSAAATSSPEPTRKLFN